MVQKPNRRLNLTVDVVFICAILIGAVVALPTYHRPKKVVPPLPTPEQTREEIASSVRLHAERLCEEAAKLMKLEPIDQNAAKVFDLATQVTASREYRAVTVDRRITT